MKLADKDARVGDWALAVGNPFGLGGTVTAGIVSALARDIGSGPYDYLQIDAAVNRGNSGGPTFNLDGDVLGVNTAIYSPSGGNVGIAFAVPAKTVNEVVKQLKSGGTVNRGWLGVKIQNVDEDTAASLGLSEPKGALISEVTPSGSGGCSLASRRRTRSCRSTTTRSPTAAILARKIAELQSGYRRLTLRSGATTPSRPSRSSSACSRTARKPWPSWRRRRRQPKPEKSSLELSQLGLTLMPARNGGPKEGVAIAEVDPSSDAAEKGLKAGDVILEVSGQPVAAPDDVVSGVKKAQDMKRSAVLLHVKSADQKRFVAVQLKDKKG